MNANTITNKINNCKTKDDLDKLLTITYGMWTGASRKADYFRAMLQYDPYNAAHYYAVIADAEQMMDDCEYAMDLINEILDGGDGYDR